MHRLIMIFIVAAVLPATAQTQTNLAGVFQTTNDGEYAAVTGKHASDWSILNGTLEVRSDAIYGIDKADVRTDRLDLEIIANCESYFFGVETRSQFEDLLDPRTSRGKLGSGVQYGNLDIRYAAAVEFNRDEVDPEPGGEIQVGYAYVTPIGHLSVRVNGFAGRNEYRTVTVRNTLTVFASRGLNLGLAHYLYHRHQHAPDNDLLLSVGVQF